MDGVYQCNRNRRNLEIPGESTSPKKTEIDFVVRQKEELLWDGTFEGQQWSFQKVNIGKFRTMTNRIPTTDGESIVHDSNAKDETRPPHDGEYVGTIEVVVLRCHHTKRQAVVGNETSSNESSEVNENSVPGNFDGASDPQPASKSKSKSEYRAPAFGLAGDWADWGPAPPPLDEPKKGRIKMTSENTGTWNPVGRASKGSNALEKTKRWNKRSDSREHFRLDFQKHVSPAGTQRDRTTDPEHAPELSVRGGGPDSHSIASSEAMRNWNRGPPARKEWAQGDPASKGGESLAPALDPWTANLPTGNPDNEAETKPQIPWEAWGTKNGTRSKSGRKKGKKSSILSRSPNRVPGTWGESNHKAQDKKDEWGGSQDQDRNQVGNGDDWGSSGGNRNGGDDWGGAGDANAQTQDGWNSGGAYAQGNNDSSGNAQNENGMKHDDAWNHTNDTSDGNKDDWEGNGNNDMQRNGDWGAADDNDENWGATTGNDAQQANSWEVGQQTDTWGDDHAKQVTTGATDPEEISKPAGRHSAAGVEIKDSAFSFGNSRATGPKLVSKAGSQGRQASVESKAASIKSNKKPWAFDWLKPSLGKASNASGSPVTMKKATVPGAGALPVVSSKQGESKMMTAPIPSTFSISTLPKSKPYWSTWRNANIAAEAGIEQSRPPSPEDFQAPIYSIRAEVAQRNMMSHQVRPGRPAAYTHKRNKPKYIDTHQSPYAVFLFKYRDKEIIEHMLKTTISEPEVDEKARLGSLSKQELIDELIKTKSKLSVVESDSSGQATFVKKLDEKLGRLETSEEDAPAIGDWVKATSPTNGQEGIGDAGAWGTNSTHKGNGEQDAGKGDGYSNDDANANGGESWGRKANCNDDGENNNSNNNRGNGDAPTAAEDSGNDWGTANHHKETSGGEKKDDDNGWGWNDNSGGDGWNYDDKNDSGDTKIGGDWDNDDGNKGAAGDWGNDQDQGGSNSWANDDGGGGGDGGWGEKDEGHANGNDNAGFESSWGANAAGGSGW